MVTADQQLLEEVGQGRKILGVARGAQREGLAEDSGTEVFAGREE